MKLESNVSFLAKGMEAVLAKMSSNNPNQTTESRQMPNYRPDQFLPSQQNHHSLDQRQDQLQWQLQQQQWPQQQQQMQQQQQWQQQQQQLPQEKWATPMETSPVQVRQSVMGRNSVHFPGEQ